MTPRVLAASSPGEVRVAVAAGDALLDYAVWRPGQPDGVGDLHRGRVLAHAPAMAGRFVLLAGGAEGFLPDSDSDGHSDGGATLTDGAAVGVRVTRAAQGGKGPRLSARLSDADRGAVGDGPPALRRRGPGAVERLAALYPEAPVLTDDAALAASLRPALGDRLAVRRDLLDDAVAGAIEALAAPSVMLASGATLHIHPTPALVAIDVDAGRATAERRPKAAAQLAFNRRLLPDLARQIRLRNLSGAILVDFAGMAARRRAALAADLATALEADPLRPRLLGFTALGFAEIVRPRVHAPLHETLCGPLAAGLAALRRVALDDAAQPGSVRALRAAPAVVAALEADPIALGDLARRLGHPLMLRSDPTLDATRWDVERR